MTLFGLSYLLVHDGLVHERLPMKFFLRWRFFRRVRGAHLHHHRFHGVPYGLFFGPSELAAAKAARRNDPGVLGSNAQGDSAAPGALASVPCESTEIA
jgi:beta-carotene 3-hydroxylase